MLKTHEKIRVPDINKEKDFFAEVNWAPKDKRTNECKVIRFSFPNGDSALVLREHLNAILFAIGKEEDQRKLIPQTINRSRHYETVVGVVATKNIQKGEQINFPIKLTLPTFSEEIIAEAQRDVINRGLTRR